MKKCRNLIEKKKKSWKIWFCLSGFSEYQNFDEFSLLFLMKYIKLMKIFNYLLINLNLFFSRAIYFNFSICFYFTQFLSIQLILFDQVIVGMSLRSFFVFLCLNILWKTLHSQLFVLFSI